MIKGSATIELTNADGSKQVIKHDNMITNAVKDLLVSQRGEIAPLFKITQNNESIARAMFGGLLLFDDTLNSNADDYFIPSAKITGYASLTSYGGMDVARGGFNELESGLQADGKSYKFVWDFSTSQGNGTIKSLALCPSMMGQIGASDTIISSEQDNFYMENDLVNPFNDDGYMLLSSGDTDNVGNYNYSIVAIVDDIAYAIEQYNIKFDSSYKSRHITKNGGKLRIYKFKLCAEKISILDKVGMARYLGYDDIALPTDFVSDLYAYSGYTLSYYFDQTGKKLLIFPCYLNSDVSVNGTIKYLEIDLKNSYAITEYTFTNNTAGYISKDSQTHNIGMRLNFCVLKDYILAISVSDKKKKLFAISRTDNTSVKKAKWGNGNEFNYSNANVGFEPIFVNGNICILKISLDTYNYNIFIFDMYTGEIRKTNATNMSIFNNVDIGRKVLYGKTGPYLTYVPTVNPFILTTKNNLDSPVTKTASQTMKITYTLTETT